MLQATILATSSGWTDAHGAAQRTYVEVAGFTHIGHMLVECKMSV